VYLFQNHLIHFVIIFKFKVCNLITFLYINAVLHSCSIHSEDVNEDMCASKHFKGDNSREIIIHFGLDLQS